MSQQFIEQTAHDYDLPVHEVERIAKLFPNEFYEKLEERIKSGSYLTKQQALSAMGSASAKISHRFFASQEYIGMENGNILLEDNISCTIEDFFASRKGPEWETGYFIID